MLAKVKYHVILISKTLIDSYIRHDELILGNNLLREYKKKKKGIKNPKIFNSISILILYIF